MDFLKTAFICKHTKHLFVYPTIHFILNALSDEIGSGAAVMLSNPLEQRKKVIEYS